MWQFLKKILLFRVGQKTAHAFARSMGMKRMAHVAGVVGGVKYMRKHS